MKDIAINFFLFLVYCSVTSGETLDQLSVRMGRMSSMEEFIDKMVRMPDGTKVNMATARHMATESGRGVYSSFIDTVALAQMDICSTRMLTYKFPKDSDPNVLYFPECMGVARCGGCCNADILECRPLRNRTIYRKTLAVRYSSHGAGTFQYLGFKMFPVVEHVACAAVCSTQASDCDPIKHIYMTEMCRCMCRNTSVCPPTKRFDPVRCTCVCKDMNIECGSQSTFNQHSCSCQAGVLASGHVVPDSRPDHERTTTTTELPGTTAHECASQVNCPGTWHPVRTSTGRCSCAPSGRFVLPGK